MTDQPKKRAPMLDHDPALQFAANARAKALVDAMPMAEPITTDAGYQRFNVSFETWLKIANDHSFQPRYMVAGDFDADQITMRTSFDDGRGSVQIIADQVMRLRERHVRDALIALGWTPPEGKA